MKKQLIVSWILQIIIAVILGQTLFFKFTAHPESVALFTKLNMEPNGRLLIGVIELIAIMLLLIPMSVPYGAILSWGVMSGALIGHLGDLGIKGYESLVAMAFVAWLLSMEVIYLRRDEIGFVKRMFARPGSKAET